MAAQEPGQQPSLTALPRLEDLPRKGDGYDPDGVRESFEAFRRHSAQLQAQLRVLQAASRSGQTVEPTGHAVRMDALHLIRTASEFADTVEADAQKASEAQLSKTEEEVRRRRREQQDREAEIERYRQEIQSRVFRAMGMSEEEAHAKFGWFLDALKMGAPPHGGFALGIERFVALLADESNIREVIAFPKTASGSDPLTGAPAATTKERLDELGISVQTPKN